jgi:hypothetical protein
MKSSGLRRLSTFSVTVLRDAAKLRRLLRTSGRSLLKSKTIPFGLRRPRFSGAVSKPVLSAVEGPCLRIYRQSVREEGLRERCEGFLSTTNNPTT